MYHAMFSLVGVMERCWPDFAHWKGVRFDPRPLAGMVVRFTHWVSSLFELYGDFDDYVRSNTDNDRFLKTLAVDDDPSDFIQDAHQWLSDLAPCHYGLGMSVDDYQQDAYPLWLYFVFSYIFRVRNYYEENASPYEQLGIQGQFKRLPPHTLEESHVYDSIIPILLEKKSTRVVGICLAYTFKETGNPFADQDNDEGEPIAIPWASHDLVLRYSQMQHEAEKIEEIYHTENERLNEEGIPATRKFVRPIYAAYREAVRRKNAAPKTLYEALDLHEKALPRVSVRMEDL